MTRSRKVKVGGVGVTTRSKIQDSLATGPRERPTGRSTGPLSKRKRRLPSCPMTRGQVAQGSFATRNLPQRCWQWRHPARARASRPGSRDPRSHVARPLRRSLDGSRWWCCCQSSQFSCLRCHFGCSPVCSGDVPTVLQQTGRVCPPTGPHTG